MAFSRNSVEYTILNGGLSVTLDVEDINVEYKIVGTANNMTVDNTFAHTGTPTAGLTYEYDYKGVATYNGGVIKFHGISMTASQALKNHRVIATYNGSSWEVDFIPDISEDSIIETNKLVDDAVTNAKLANMTRGTVKVGGTSNAPTDLDAKTSGQILVGDGTDIVSVPVSGDITLSSAGAVAIAAGVIVNADISGSANIAVSKIAKGSSAQILLDSGAAPTWTTVSGDVTINNSGVVTIANDAVENAMMATDSVTLSNLASTGQLYSFTTSTGTGANTNETALASFAMTSAIGDADGDVLDVYAYGSCANTATVKTIRVRFGATLATATALCTNTTTGSPQNVNWCIKGKIFRTGAAAQKGNFEIIFGGVATELDNFTAVETWSTSTVYLSGQNGTANANDILLEGFEVKIGRTNNN